MTRIEKAQQAYFEAFGSPPPEPFGVDDDHVAEVLEKAVAAGRPVAASFDWWEAVPPDAVA